MSSPKRAAKSGSKAAAKPARRAPATKSAGKPKMQVVEGASADAIRVAAVIERSIADGKLDMVSAEALQKLLAAACRLYTARAESGEQLATVPKNSITATDVMVTASGLLKAVDLAVFELGMWQSWTGR
jgi:3-oxoacyl-ACP reductase-like protein